MTRPHTSTLDVHAHFLPPVYREALTAAGIVDPDGLGLGFPNWTLEAHRDLLDDAGIDRALLSISSPGLLLDDGASAAVELARRVNDAGASALHTDGSRFGFLASLPLPDVPSAITEWDRARGQLGAEGVTLMTNFAGMYLGDSRLDPLYAELDRSSAVVLIHPTSPAGWESVALGRTRSMIEFHFDTTRTVVDLILAEVTRRFPGIRFVMPHAGAVLPLLVDRVDRLASMIAEFEGRPRVDVIAAVRELTFDLAGGPLPRNLPALLSMVGPERLVFGSDYPFTPVAAILDSKRRLEESDLLSASQRAAVFGAEALAFGGGDTSPER